MTKHLLIFLFTMILSIGLHADDGMWMPHQMKNLDLEKEGLKMSPGDLYRKDGTGIMSGVVYLGGGTGSFVSRKGLILTNHHVAFGAIQRVSDRENDYILNGFLADSPQKEIPAIGYIADVLLGYEEVTTQFHTVLNGINDPEKRYKTIEDLEKKMISEEEKKSEDRRCVIKSMYAGNQYFLFRFKRIKDIRLVYAPPRAIGNFGGDADNWMWPRHTGDFTFLRAYVSKENIGAEFHENNVPYLPKSVLNISLNGLSEGDFTFVMGYPGRTYRNMVFSELSADIDKLKDAIELRGKLIAFLEKSWEGDREVQIRYASLHKGLNNGLKNFTGKLEGFRANEVLTLKRRNETDFLSWSEKHDPSAKIRENLDRLNAVIRQERELNKKIQPLRTLVSRYGSALLSNAYTLYRVASERGKPDIDREPGYQQRDYQKIRVALEHAEKSYHIETDKAMLKFILNLIREEEHGQWPDTFKILYQQNGIDDFVDDMYKKTRINNKDARLKMFEMDLDALIASGDPFILLASRLENEMKVIRETQKVVSQEKEDLKGGYIKGLMKYKNGRLAPDANSSIRFTFGNIAGYQPRDGVYFKPFTLLKGVMEKETGNDPFIVPEKLKKLWTAKKFGLYADKKKNDVVTCFLNTTNVTGGNSGSPVLNAHGKQVGIVFDMTYESVTGDYYVIPELQRTIHVDIRYVMFVTEYVAGAGFLVREMGL